MHKNQIQDILGAADSSPRHRFGQHFMLDENMLETIAAAAELTPQDIVLEIGPGVGNLTAIIAPQVGRVLAVDIDGALLRAAANHWQSLKNVRWMQADALAGKHCLNPDVMAAITEIRDGDAARPVKLVANLPYNAASPLIAELLVAIWADRHTPPGRRFALDRLVFTVQWEVAQRMAAGPGSSDYGALGILIQVLAHVEILRPIDRQCFWPPPKVKSALVRITPKPQGIAALADVPALQRLLAALFGHRRQNLGNAIRHGLHPENFSQVMQRLRAEGINPLARPADLSASEFIKICDIMHSP